MARTWRGACQLDLLGDGWQWWSGSYLALHGQINTIFRPSLMGAWRGPSGCSDHIWSYPPSMLLLILPMGLLPPLIGVGLFDCLGLVCFGWAIRLAGIRGGLWIAMMTSPVVIYNFVSNQNGSWFGAFLISGLVLSERRPVLGGILLGLLTVKPQTCLLLPIYLLGRRNWLCLLAAGLTSAALLAASAYLFSWQSWVLFAAAVLPAMQHVLETFAAPQKSFMFITVYALARWASIPAGWSNGIQLMSSLAAMITVYYLAMDAKIEPPVRWALVAIIGVLAAPYMQNYDLFAATFGCGILLRDELNGRSDPVKLIALALLWAIPGLTPWLGLLKFPPLTPMLAVLVSALTIRSGAKDWKSLENASTVA